MMFSISTKHAGNKSKQQLLISLVISLSVIVSACASRVVQTEVGSTSPTLVIEKIESTQVIMNETQDQAMKDAQGAQHGTMQSVTQEPIAASTAQPGMDDDSNDQLSTGELVAVPDWFSVQLTNINKGETFSLQDYRGKVVLVETMAIWCSNCLQQQRQVKILHETLGERDDFISLALDIDPNENAEDLKGFIDRNGFDWHYAVAPVEVAREIGNLYGAQFLNPPSTPMLIVDRHGEVHPLPFGIKDAQMLIDALDPYLAESV